MVERSTVSCEAVRSIQRRIEAADLFCHSPSCRTDSIAKVPENDLSENSKKVRRSILDPKGGPGRTEGYLSREQVQK